MPEFTFKPNQRQRWRIIKKMRMLFLYDAYNLANPWVARVFLPSRKIARSSQEVLKRAIRYRLMYHYNKGN